MSKEKYDFGYNSSEQQYFKYTCLVDNLQCFEHIKL